MSQLDPDRPSSKADQHPAKTKISFARLTQEVRVFLDPAVYPRRVQVLIPEGSQKVLIDEDRPVGTNPDGSSKPGAVGRNRVYKLPEFPPGQQIEFMLAPGQWLVGAVDDGTARLTVIVEPVQ